MSPMNAGPVAAISMHQYAKMPWAALFADAEAIFRGAGGRPHWAKRHTLSRADVATLYPMASRYIAVRRADDPPGNFLNPHLEALFACMKTGRRNPICSAGRNSETHRVRKEW